MQPNPGASKGTVGEVDFNWKGVYKVVAMAFHRLLPAVFNQPSNRNLRKFLQCEKPILRSDSYSPHFWAVSVEYL